MKEIGGYFGLEKFAGEEFYSKLIAVNNARNALVYLVKAKKIRKIYIPCYLCDCVKSVCDKEGIDYEHYHINESFLPDFDKSLDKNEFLYVVNYFGQIDIKTIIKLKEKFGNIILDNVQAFFQKPIEGIDTIYSCRKFFGVPDGGYLSTDVTLEEPLCVDVSMERMHHMLGRFEGSARDYFLDFKQSEKDFDEVGLSAMSKLTHNILSAVDYDVVKRKREMNFDYLHKHLGQKNILAIKNPEGPYVYPFYCKEGLRVRKELAERNIFVSTLWPNVISSGSSLEREYAENILPLPCDQRYDEMDMKLVVDFVTQIIK